MRAKTALVALACVLAIAGCSRRQQAAQPAPPSAPAATAPAPSASIPMTPQAPVTAAASCNAVPTRAQVQDALKAAMVQIYGGEESGANFVVTDITPVDCSHLTVAYQLKGASATPEKAPLEKASDGTWSLTLFKKPYPVK
jgi:hypothetical protein